MSDFDKRIAETSKENENKEKTTSSSTTTTNDKTLEGLVNLGKTRQTVDSKMKVFFNGLIRVMPIIIINLLALFIIGLDNFIDGKWDWSTFASPEFWYSYLRFQTANWLLAITYLNAALKKIKKNHLDFNNNLKEIQAFVNLDHEDEFIGDQAEIETIIRKRYYLEIKVSKKLLKLKERHKIVNLDDFYRDSDINTLNWRKRRTHAKITSLYEMLTKEWAINNLKGYKIKYPKVNRSLLVSGFQPSQSDGRFNTYTSNTVSSSFKLIAPSTLTVSILMVVLLAFEPIRKEASLGTWLKFASQTLVILWNTLMVTSLAYTIFEMTTLRSSDERKSDLGIFYKRHLNNNENEQYAVSILNGKDKNNEVYETTEVIKQDE